MGSLGLAPALRLFHTCGPAAAARFLSPKVYVGRGMTRVLGSGAWPWENRNLTLKYVHFGRKNVTLSVLVAL